MQPKRAETASLNADIRQTDQRRNVARVHRARICVRMPEHPPGHDAAGASAAAQRAAACRSRSTASRTRPNGTPMRRFRRTSSITSSRSCPTSDCVPSRVRRVRTWQRSPARMTATRGAYSEPSRFERPRRRRHGREPRDRRDAGFGVRRKGTETGPVFAAARLPCRMANPSSPRDSTSATRAVSRSSRPM